MPAGASPPRVPTASTASPRHNTIPSVSSGRFGERQPTLWCGPYQRGWTIGEAAFSKARRTPQPLPPPRAMPSTPPKPTLAIYREDPAPQAGEIRKVLCCKCTFHYRPTGMYGRVDRCERMAEYEIDCVTGKALLTTPADCRVHNANMDCPHFELKRSLWARFLDWL